MDLIHNNINSLRYIPQSNTYTYIKPNLTRDDQTYSSNADSSNADSSNDDSSNDDSSKAEPKSKHTIQSQQTSLVSSGPSKDLKINSKTKHNNIDVIDINNIMYDVLMDNKIIVIATIPLFIGYYLQDTIFTRYVAAFTSDITGFVRDIDTNKIIIMILPYVVAMILFYVSSVFTSKSMTRIELDTIQELIDQILESIRTTKKPVNINDLMIHLKKMAGIKNIYSLFVTYIVPTFIVAITLIYTFSQSDGYYGIIVALIILVLMLVTLKLEFDSIEYAYDTEDSSNVLFDEIHEILSNVDTVITSNTKDTELKRVEKVKTNTYKLSMNSQVSNNNSTYGLQFLSLGAMLGINYIAYKLYERKLMDPVAFTSSILLSLLFMDYYNYCINAISELISSIGRYYETREYFLGFNILKQTDEDKKNEIDLQIKRGNIVLKDLTINYDNKSILNKFNFVVEGNKITGFVGPIGSGKTTILKAIAGILEYSGDIIIDGQNLKNCSYKSISRSIAYIPQHPKLFNRSVYYNINYGSSFTQNEINKKIERMGLKPFIDSLPNKLNTIAGKEGSKLSGGQKQFIFFIRSIIQNKSIFLLDEPTSSLDSTNKNILFDLIKSMKNKTVIISTHDKQLVPLFNTTFNMSKKTEYENQ